MRKSIPGFLILAGVVFGVVAYGHLPSQVVIHWEALVPWVRAADVEPIPRPIAAFGLPVLATIVWLLLVAVASPSGERIGRRIFPDWLLGANTGANAVERFGPTFHVIVASVVAFVLVLHALMLGTALGWPGWTFKVFAALVGVGMIGLGNIMPRTRPNWVAGLRTKATLADPNLWRRTHRWFGGLLLACGVIVVGASLIDASTALLIAIVGGFASALVASTVAAREPPAPN